MKSDSGHGAVHSEDMAALYLLMDKRNRRFAQAHDSEYEITTHSIAQSINRMVGPNGKKWP